MVFFFDPHPGFAGCSERIPESVRLVANALDQTETTVEDAIARIQTACPEGKIKDHPDSIHGNKFISLSIGEIEVRPGLVMGQYNWRVIRYDDKCKRCGEIGHQTINCYFVRDY